ncbi:hypothetical protein [Micromonospora sp. SL4-19]|uniref:hypothetical protein n=1 Tax=Micromonospora sp. SL4-19 TaxID=3399129 RepID=UPI003A4DE20C
MALVVCSLVPYLVLTVAVFPLGELISASLDTSRPALQMTVSLSAGAYAVGTLLAAQFAMHLPPRRMLIGYEVCFFAASNSLPGARTRRCSSRPSSPKGC